MFNGHICSNIVIFSYLNDIERTGWWGVYMSLSSRGFGIAGWRRRYCGFVFAGRSRKMSAVSPSPGRFSPERKTPPGVSAPSAGLRPLIVSRVKCGGRTLSRPLSDSVHEKCDMPSMHFFLNCGRFDIGLPETRSGCDRALLI